MKANVSSKQLINCAISIIFALSINACSSGSTAVSANSESSPIQPNISFSNNNLQIAHGSLQTVYLTLNNANNATESEYVAISTLDKSVAAASPSECILSAANPSCQVRVYGLVNGNTKLKAVSRHYGELSAPATTTSTFNYGSLGVESSMFFSLSSLTDATVPNGHGQDVLYVPFSTYESDASGNYNVYITGGLLNSSGITESNVLFSMPGAFDFLPVGADTCPVTTNSPVCTIHLAIPASDVTPETPYYAFQVVASMVGGLASRHQYNSIIIQLQPNPNKIPGEIVLATVGNTSTVPIGMNAPLLINWNNVAINGNVNVVLTSSNPSAISFYHYNPGNNLDRINTATESCTLSYPNILSCGFGLSGLSSGSTTISAVATANNGESYTINSITLTAKSQESSIRVVNFINNSSESMAVGITGGGANAYNSPQTTVVLPGTPSGSGASSKVSLCGPSSNGTAACPTGSTCVQGGATPSKDITTSQYLCFYDQPVPVCGSGCTESYVLQPGGSTTLSISGSSGHGDQTEIIWSGNYYARTNCNSVTGICENATCVGGAGGLACGVGTGGSPGVQTLAEETFQRNGSLDYYDVSIINGLNFAASFGPTTVPADPNNAYTCGTAGDVQAQSGGWEPPYTTTSGLPGAAWSTTPNASSFPAPNIVPEESATSYFRFVSYIDGAATCQQDADCVPSGNVCGYWIGTTYNNLNGSKVINSRDADYIKHCGKQIAWLTANEIYGLNQFGFNIAELPFNYTESFYSVNAGQITVGNLQLCNGGTYSAYGPPNDAMGVAACGGVSWNESDGDYITRVQQPVAIVGQNWMNNVLPTIFWLKNSCPTCYTFPFDDMSSTFTCNQSTQYTVTFSNQPH